MATPLEHAGTRIRLCGEFAVQIDGRRLEAAIRGSQARTLLSYLVLHRGRPVRRQELIEVLWPAASPASPQDALSTLVSRLRKAVGHDTIRGRSELRLALAADASIDVESAFEAIARAEQAIERCAWEDATRCAHSALEVAVQGFLPDVDAAWAEHERRRLEEVRMRALECLAVCGLQLGGARLAVSERAARELMAIDPYRETGHRYLMQALSERGRVAEALRVFDDVRVLLQAQLGVPPSAGLRMLHERLLGESGRPRAGEPDDPLAVVTPTRIAGAGAPSFPQASAVAAGVREPFFGRDDDLRRLWDVYRRSTSGACGLAFVRGEPGIGKTRLVVELARRAQDDGAVALYGRCDEEPLHPHQPFVEALGHYVAVCPLVQLSAQVGPGGSELRRLVPGLAERLPALAPPVGADPDGERYRLFEAVGALLRRVAEARPVVLVLDDLHWADRPTLLLLRHIARYACPPGLLVLGTYRDAEIGSEHPLRDTLGDLSRDRDIARVSLGALDVAAAAQLVTSQAGQQSSELVRALWEETEGNPFFMGETLRHLAQSGRLSTAAGPRAPGSRLSDLGIPDSVKDVIGRRIALLSQPAQAVLATASVSGRAFEFAVLDHMSSRDQDELLHALEEAVGARLIEEVPDAAGRYAFTHALIRETIYGGLMRTRRVLLHLRIGAALEAIHAPDPSARSAELAHHFAQSSAPEDITKAIGYALQAADAARAGLAFEQAAAHYRQAAGLLASAASPALSAQRCDLVIAQGEAERQAGDAAYRATLLEGARLAQELGDADRLARAALANNRGFFSAAAGVDDERVAMLDAALEAHGAGDSSTRASLLAQLAVELVPDADWARRAQLSDEALAMARRVGDPMTLARTLNHRYVALWGPRSLNERLANTREASALADELHNPGLSFQSARFGAHAAMEAGDLVLADTLLERARELAGELGQPIIHWYYAVTHAKRESISGSPAVAEQLVRDAAALGRRIGQPDATLWLAIGLFVTRLLQGTRAGPAEDAPDGARAAAAATGSGAQGSRSVVLLTTALEAAAACEAGRTGDARAGLATLMSHDLRDLPHGWTALAVPAVAARTCARLGYVGHAGTLFAVLEPYAGQFVDAGPAWFGAVGHHLAGLATTLGRHHEADAFFAEADRMYATLGAGAWSRRLRLDRDRSHGLKAR